MAKLNNNGVLSSAEYAEQAAEIENKIKTLRTERRKKLSENQDDEMLDELKTLRQILDEYKPHAEFDEALFEIIVKRIEVVNNSQLCFKLLGDIELTETINRKARCKQREEQDNPVWV